MKPLIVMTVVGLGIIGLAIWVYFASEPGPGRPGINACTSDTSRHGLCARPDGSIWLVDFDGQLSQIQPAHAHAKGR